MKILGPLIDIKPKGVLKKKIIIKKMGSGRSGPGGSSSVSPPVAIERTPFVNISVPSHPLWLSFSHLSVLNRRDPRSSVKSRSRT